MSETEYEDNFEEMFKNGKYSTEVELTYGKIAKKDIPIVMMEPEYYKYARFGSWFGFIVFGMLFLIYLVAKESRNRHRLRNITSKYLLEERDRQTNIQNRLMKFDHAQLSIPYSKYIDIFIPITNFSSVRTFQPYDNELSYVNSLFAFYIIGKSGALSQVKSQWEKRFDVYFTRFTMSNFLQLYGMVIYFSSTKVFSQGLDKTINTININLRDQNEDIIWRDIITIDIASGDSSVGPITGNYIPVQFDLSKYRN